MESISKALVKFQSKLKPVTKDSKNPFFQSRYADLSSILQAVMPILSESGLALTQPMRIDGDKTILITKLIHESGESIASEMILPTHSDPQKLGSLITYYKRYQLQALLGISTEEDDDGNSVSQFKQQNQASQNVNRQNPSAPSQALASEAQKKAMTSMGISFPENVTKAQASDLIGQANNKR